MNTEEPDQHLLLQLLQNAPIGFWSWDLNTNAEWWSKGFYELLNLDPEKINPSYEFWIDDILHPEDKASVIEAVDNHIKHSTPYLLRIRLKVGDQWKWFKTTGEVERDENGTPILMNGSILNVDRLISMNIQLSEQNEILSEISNLGSIGSWKIDLTSSKVTWSEEVYRIHDASLDYEPSVTDGVQFYTPEFRSMVQKSIDDAVERKQTFQFEAKIQTLLGKVKWVRSVGKTVCDSQGKVISIVGLFQDITRDMESLIEKDNAYRIIEKQNKRLLNFAHIVSHNLRTHAGNMEMLHGLSKQINSENELKEILVMLERASQGLSETIDHLNEVVAIQTNEDLPITSINLKKQIETILQNMNAQITDDQAKVQLNIPESHSILFNPAYFDSVILNLVSNALKFKSPKRTPSIKIESKNLHPGFKLCISDNGVGIDLERHEDKLFGLYKTFHNIADSRGIGLFITKNQLDALGAQIRVESKVDFGTTFKIIFPN